jgi:PadR family transcriptional regulator PadR
MRESTYFILAALQDGPLHGYAILQRVSELSTGQVSLATGTLYTALERLTSSGHIHIVDEQIVNGRARRSYELTSVGGAALKEQADRLASAARVVTERRVTRPAVRPA